MRRAGSVGREKVNRQIILGTAPEQIVCPKDDKPPAAESMEWMRGFEKGDGTILSEHEKGYFTRDFQAHTLMSRWTTFCENTAKEEEDVSCYTFKKTCQAKLC